MESLLLIVALAIVAIGPIWYWARRIEKRVEPPDDRPGDESERYRFKYHVPPGAGGSGTISGIG